MDRTVAALSAAASPRATIVRRALATATCAGAAAAALLFAGPAAAAGQVCLTDGSTTTCRPADNPGNWFIQMTVDEARNASSYAVTLYRAGGWDSRCLEPGQQATFPAGYPINRIRIGPTSTCFAS